jgi:hypothetical protein
LWGILITQQSMLGQASTIAELISWLHLGAGHDP